MGGKIYYIPPKTKDFKGFTKGLYDLVKNEKYEHVLRITSNSIGFYDLLVAKKAGAKICAARSSNSSDGGSFRVRAVNRLARVLLLRYVDVMIAPSDLAAEYTFGKQMVRKGKVHFLKNAIDLNEFSYSKISRKEIREEFALNDEFVIGHIGRFSEQKNHKFLVDIFAKVLENIPNAVLLLVGEGELRGKIDGYVRSKGIQKNVIFAGVRKDIAKLLSAMDVFVLPSLYEGMPNVIIEAQATGLPCVIADTITREADLTGLVNYLSFHDIEEWINNIKKIYCHQAERKAYVQDMQQKGYDIEKEVEKFLGYF